MGTGDESKDFVKREGIGGIMALEKHRGRNMMDGCFFLLRGPEGLEPYTSLHFLIVY